MSERCPLSGGGIAIEDLPVFCRLHCEEKWSEAVRTGVGETDDYGASTEFCQHQRYGVVHSHESLQATDSSSDRFYAVVDKCEECETELMETSYIFQCQAN